jgi:hypothetical protein
LALGALMAACGALGLTACSSVPAEAPQLSAELGNRISAIQQSHFALLRQFMDERRERIDEFVNEEWAPRLTTNTFEDPRMKEILDKVAASPDPNARVQLMARVGPKIQKHIQEKRNELMKPLDEIERALERQLRQEYDQALGVNNALTSYLSSAAKLDANRDRYVAMAGNALGVQLDVDKHLDETAALVEGLVAKRDAAAGAAADVETLVKEFRVKADGLVKAIAAGTK